MAKIDPQQELFTAYKLKLEALGYSVYDGALPPKDTPYPFIYLGNFRQSDSVLKNAVMGTVYPIIHVWHNNPRQRGTVSAMLFDIKKVIYQTEQTSRYSWIISNVNSEIIPDNSTETPLLHGYIEAGAKFT